LPAICGGLDILKKRKRKEKEMGWSYEYCNVYNAKEAKAKMDERFNCCDVYEVVKSTVVNRVYYAVVKYKSEDENCTFAAISLLEYGKGEFGHKDMEDSSCPFCYDFPVSWLKLLSPTTDEYAIQWRKEVVEYHKQKRAKNKK